jgi:NAD(P)-dependent dehydrogenase (short-subunit alcohol dehydrogenase family)
MKSGYILKLPNQIHKDAERSILMKTWFITGISRGLGKALAEEALARGDLVVGTVRDGRPDIATGKGTLHALTLEMTDRPAVAAAVGKAFDLAGGHLDVLVNNAGYGLLGAVEDADEDDIARLFEVDLMAPLRLIRAALPRFRAQGSGHIVNVTSIAGRAPGAGSAFYAAAKFGLEGFSLSLAQEVAPLGIKVTAVAPGAFRTDFLSAHSVRKSAPAAPGYEETAGKMLRAFDEMEGRQLGDPALAAAAIVAAVEAAEPPLQLLLGSDAWRRMKKRHEEQVAEMGRWEKVTLSTDYV